MIDTLLAGVADARARNRAASLKLEKGRYGFVTIHRPSNVDDARVFRGLVELLVELATEMPLVFPVHPRTGAMLERTGLQARLRGVAGRLICLTPQPYLDTLSLVADAAVVLTDSGGLQEETTALGVPCLTLRDNTERPVTVERGTSSLVGNDPARIRRAWRDVLDGTWPRGRSIPLWDGHAAGRIACELRRWLGCGPPASRIRREATTSPATPRARRSMRSREESHAAIELVRTAPRRDVGRRGGVAGAQRGR
jgi:UDP-N-acetylglucosamine 2-epimerase (non-hydrolysing)